MFSPIFPPWPDVFISLNNLSFSSVFTCAMLVSSLSLIAYTGTCAVLIDPDSSLFPPPVPHAASEP
ncbi:MAG: hypothetical protein ACK5HA_18065, partial [Planctomycetaceae bacterium]